MSILLRRLKSLTPVNQAVRAFVGRVVERNPFPGADKRTVTVKIVDVSSDLYKSPTLQTLYI